MITKGIYCEYWNCLLEVIHYQGNLWGRYPRGLHTPAITPTTGTDDSDSDDWDSEDSSSSDSSVLSESDVVSVHPAGVQVHDLHVIHDHVRSHSHTCTRLCNFKQELSIGVPVYKKFGAKYFHGVIVSSDVDDKGRTL